MNLIDRIKACQIKVGATPDGKPGPDTWTRIFAALGLKEPSEDNDVIPTGEVDARSEKAIATLHDKVKPYARALVQQAAAQGITIKVISGTRSYAEQDELFKKRPKVTNARGGYSWHNHQVAFDVGIFKGATYVPESPAYKAVGAIGQGLGLEWGGSWNSFKDEPHFQMTNGKTLAQARALREQGKTVFD